MSQLEIIVESTHDALIAEKHGANQLDLKACYCQGGVTTSAGTIEMICHSVSIPVLVMIHPHNPIFCYSKSDLKIMSSDIRLARSLGASNFLIGCITPKKEIDQSALRQLRDAAGEADLHFNLVWQLTREPFTALDVLISHDIKSIRSSGKGFLGDQAVDHLPELKAIQAHVDGKMQVFAAGGVNAQNMAKINTQSGVYNFHTGSGARKPAQPFGPVNAAYVQQLKDAIDGVKYF
ncbi:MAG: hypothetical protein JEZ00_19760 [Anaerolineaceae bacterium]|nr:hypothetical protein [Anaerolineaceae bacterium]